MLNLADAGLADIVDRGHGFADGFVDLFGDGRLHRLLGGLLESSLKGVDEPVRRDDNALRFGRVGELGRLGFGDDGRR